MRQSLLPFTQINYRLGLLNKPANNTFRLTYGLPWLNQRHPVVPQRIAR
jgi:hypothetical protein